MSNGCPIVVKVFAGAVLACVALPAVKASPVVWLATGFTFTDGSTLTGGVTYDAATNTYSNILMLATGGTSYNNVFYPYWNPSLPASPDYLALVAGLPSSDLTGVASLWIIPNGPLTGPPGSIVQSSLALEVLCADPACLTVDNATLAAAGTGELVAFAAPAAVPEPATALLLPAAFLAFAGLKRLRSHREGPRG